MPDEAAEIDPRLEQAWSSLEQGDIESALGTARILIDENGDDPEAHYLAGSALMEADDLGEAEAYLTRALELDPDFVEARSAYAELLYQTCRFSEAGEQVGILLEEDQEDPHGHHLASLLAERHGELAVAEEEERLAHRFAPDVYPLPPRFTRAEFDRVVEAAEAELPEPFRERMGNLAIVVEDVPSEAIMKTLDEPTPGLLGLFVGTPLPEKHLGDVPQPPDAIYLFKRNLERICETREELIEEIRITLLHEVGHFLGLDEQQLADSGYE